MRGKTRPEGSKPAVAMLASWVTNWEDPTLTAEWIVDAGDDVAVVAVWRARGEGSGVASEWRHGAVWTFRDGKVIEVISYPDPAETLAAVGCRSS